MNFVNAKITIPIQTRVSTKLSLSAPKKKMKESAETTSEAPNAAAKLVKTFTRRIVAP